MFTVGYGDLTPKNPVEILVVLVVQILGNPFITQELLTSATSSTKLEDTFPKWMKQKNNFTEEYPTLKNFLKIINLPLISRKS